MLRKSVPSNFVSAVIRAPERVLAVLAPAGGNDPADSARHRLEAPCLQREFIARSAIPGDWAFGARRSSVYLVDGSTVRFRK